MRKLKAEKRGLFEIIFGKKPKPQPRDITVMSLLNGYVPVISGTGESIWYNDIIRSIIHVIASNVAKTKCCHVRRINGRMVPQSSNIEDLLQIRPNIYMNSYDFFYKIMTNLLIHNNAFVYVDVDDKGNVKGYYPINAAIITFMEVKESTEIFVKFNYRGGRQIILPYTDLIHLRRYYCENDIFGSYNTTPLAPSLQLVNTINESIDYAVKYPAKLRGILKFAGVLKAEDIDKYKSSFLTDYMSINNEGGVAAIDGKAEFQPVEQKPILLDGPQIAQIEEKLFKYFNISKDIVMGNYQDWQWDSFYQTNIEPYCLQLGLEFTAKTFTQRERNFGNQLVMEANRMALASAKTKAEVLKYATPVGVFTINEMREMFFLQPIENGDVRLISLNFVDADKMDEYQNIGKGGDNIDDEEIEGNPVDGSDNAGRIKPKPKGKRSKSRGKGNSV